jgi:hypothetical protein
MQLDFFREQEEEQAEKLTKVCRYCEEELSIDNFALRYKGYEAKGIQGRDHICKACKKESDLYRKHLKKSAPKQPENMLCECCGTKVDTFYFDHCHETGKFRGWVCRSCNVGIGFLGDNIEGLEKALAYLRKIK